ncbi:MAG TPA: hypothetical protein VLA87_13100, partial [Gaiellaceae bacterium]|nr:hypothetical protein [Gaiellaceae bacterium]
GVRCVLAFVVVVGLLAACSAGDEQPRLTRDEAAAKALTSAAPGARVMDVRVANESEDVRVEERPLPTSIRDNYPGPVWIVEVEFGGSTSWVIVDDRSGEPVLVISPQPRATEDQGD